MSSGSEETPVARPGEQHVDPWTVTGTDEGIDYDKLIDQFGSQRITPEQIERMERLTGKPAHPWLKRGRFFIDPLKIDTVKAISSPTEIWTKFWICTRLASLSICTLAEDPAVTRCTLAT